MLLNARHFWKIKTEFSPILTCSPPFLTSAIHPRIEKRDCQGMSKTQNEQKFAKVAKYTLKS